MKNTYSIWDDSSWTKMKLVTVKNNVGQILDNYAVRLIVDYDSDMQSDYGDIRFKHEDYETIWLDYWIEDKNVNSAIVWVKFPSLPLGQSNMYMFYGNPGTTDQSDFYSVFSDWDEEWANDEKVSTHIYSEGAWDPDVAYGNSRFLVVWEEGQAPGNGILFYKQSIRGSIFDTNGNAINEDFTIRSGRVNNGIMKTLQLSMVAGILIAPEVSGILPGWIWILRLLWWSAAGKAILATLIYIRNGSRYIEQYEQSLMNNSS